MHEGHSSFCYSMHKYKLNLKLLQYGVHVQWVYKIDNVLVQSIEASSNILSLLVNHVIFELKYKTLHFDHTIKYWSESLLEYVLPQ